MVYNNQLVSFRSAALSALCDGVEPELQVIPPKAPADAVRLPGPYYFQRRSSNGTYRDDQADPVLPGIRSLR